jgi:hypothetical protein
MTALCTFCLKAKGDPTPWCKGNPGLGCTYGWAHEFLEPEVRAAPPPRVDKKLCTRCGLHPKNPAYAASGCAHEHGA